MWKFIETNGKEQLFPPVVDVTSFHTTPSKYYNFPERGTLEARNSHFSLFFIIFGHSYSQRHFSRYYLKAPTTQVLLNRCGEERRRGNHIAHSSTVPKHHVWWLRLRTDRNRRLWNCEEQGRSRRQSPSQSKVVSFARCLEKVFT